jgi:flagellar hook-associated protein 1 FlgK
MGVGFGSYEIARSGLLVNERALYVTGHNISNVNTPGFVRQQAMITTGPYLHVQGKNGLYQLGLGADIQQIRQIRNIFLDNIFRQENTTLGYWEARAKTLSDIEGILGEPMETGLQNIMNQFWDAWQELSKEPDSLTVRALVRQRGEALVHHANHLASQLDKLQQDLNTEIRVRIDEVNEITREIAKLNIEIMKNEASGDIANDYRDRRNLLVDNLSKLLDCQVYENPDGQLEITVGGYYLVNRHESAEIVAEPRDGWGEFYTVKLKETGIELNLKSGTLKGLLESRGEVSGVKGSIENGMPNNKVDIVIAVDVSDSSDSTYLARVKANIGAYAEELRKSGLDFNLRLITYGNTVLSNDDFGTDAAALADAIPDSPLPAAGMDGNFGGPGGLLEAMEGLSFRENVYRYALVFTPENCNPPAGAGDYSERLEALGINTSVITDSAYYTSGVGEEGWDKITGATGGGLYDIYTPADGYELMITSIGSDTNDNVNVQMSVVHPSNNIVSHMKIRLNALINIIAREINYLHQSGYKLGISPSRGDAFFVAIDDNYPIGLGNIKLNDNLADLANIASSGSGAPGDNTIALKIANLRHSPVLADLTGRVSIDDYYRSIILEIGYNASDAERISANQRDLIIAADKQRQSIAGVSMDEEMANMMKYKFAYNAASRAINVIDKMIETIIEKVGLAGR